MDESETTMMTRPEPQRGSNPPRVLTIAGSDSGGGAGIEADLKTMAVLGCYGMAAITAITAQNTVGVFGIHDIPPVMVSKQIDVVLDDLGADAAKTGMLSSAAIIEAVASSLRRHPIERLVVDPVMVAKSGDALLRPEARDALCALLLPLAYILTPNVPEAEIIAGKAIGSAEDVRGAAETILGMGPRYVLIKGGHLDGEQAVDYLCSAEGVELFPGPRIATRNTHGTGCTLSSAIACYLAMGRPAGEAVARAKEYLTGAIRHALPLGSGHGPLDHLWALNRA
jgi:hydroxymethylpyrimidine/phosphomethylpyrimidine kinase